MKTIGTLFSGFGGVDIGAMAAGLTPLWAVEYDPAIADMYRRNIGEHVTVADILQLDPLDFEPVDVLHASPPCPNFSVAKAGAEETEDDVALGRKVAEFVKVLRPVVFTLENVYGYRKAKSFRIIVKALAKAGYQYRWWHLNAADFGVPQTRKRLILVARLDGVPQRPHATHAPAADLTPLFDERKAWVGWYEAIEDLIPSLPDSAFAPWQLERLPAELRTMLVPAVNGDGTAHPRNGSEPTHTIQATAFKQTPRAFIVGGANTSAEQAAPGVGVSEHGEPTRAVANNADRWRAFIVDGKLNDNSTSLTTRDGDARSVTVTTSHNNRDVKAYVVDYGNTSRDATVLPDDEPMVTVQAWHGRRPSHAPHAINGRVVQMTPRALARFQSIPDWYALPESKTLACRGIGNAVPPLLYQRVIEAQLR